MMNRLPAKSFILSSSFNSPGVFESHVISYLLSLSNKLLNTLSGTVKNSSLIPLVTTIPWKSILVVFFILSLAILPPFNIQVSAFPASQFNDLVLNQRQFGIPLTSLSNIFLLPLIGMLISQYRHKTKGKLKFTNLDILLLSLFLITEISILLGINPQASFVWLLKLAYSLAIYFVFSRIILNSKQLSLMVFAIIGMVLFQGLLASMQFFRGGLVGIPIENVRSLFQNEGLFNIQGSLYFRVVGTLSHPTILGAFIALLMPISILLRFYKTTTISSIFSHIATVMCIGIQVLAASRWGLVTVSFAFLFTFMLLNILNKISLKTIWKTVKIDILVLLMFGITILFNHTITTRFTQFSLEDKSLVARLELISQTLYMVKEQPLLGIGLGGFTSYLVNYDVTSSQISEKFPASAHSFYLLLASEIGIVGLIMTLMIILFLIKSFLKNIKYLMGENRLIAIGLFASCCTYFFNGFWDARQLGDRVGFLFFLILGLLINILSHRNLRLKTSLPVT